MSQDLKLPGVGFLDVPMGVILILLTDMGNKSSQSTPNPSRFSKTRVSPRCCSGGGGSPVPNLLLAHHAHLLLSDDTLHLLV